MLKTTKKKELYKSLISMNSLSRSIQSYNIFYGIKQAAFFFILFAELITNDYLRIIPALCFGYFVSKAILDIAVNIPKNKDWVIISISIFDFFMLCVITNVLKQPSWTAVINLLIFCGFVTYIGYWLNQVFVLKVAEKEAEEKAELEQNRADAEQIRADLNNAKAELEQNRADAEQVEAALNNAKAELEQNRADAEQVKADLNNAKADLEQNRADAEQVRADLNNVKAELEQNRADAEQVRAVNNQIDLVDTIDLMCPHCNADFPSKKSRDAHKGRCKMNPKNI
ncbi:DUF874 family protein [Tenacibaculum finnmarkense]|nr:DUF874 family protein [Tenacibaculum finnmarkense]MCG8239585.1 DUF874 family protein [Tenacibaculum finnmarkense genomovar ulcerans]